MTDDDIEIYKAVRRAIKDGDLASVVQVLEIHPGSLHMNTPFGSWLHMASAHGKLEIVRWLVSQGIELNGIGGMGDRRPLDEAAATGNVDVAKFLIQSGAILDTSDSVRNPLFAAIVGGMSDSHTAVARLLIDSGIDTGVKYNGENMNDMDALTFAKEWGRSGIVKLLEKP